MAAEVLQSQGHLEHFPAFYDQSTFAGSDGQEMFPVYDTAPLSAQRYIVPSTVLHSTESSRRPSLSPQQFRTAPRRDRTPIQHQRRSLPRSGSQSRSEALMTYVSDQLLTQQQLLPAQHPSLTVVPSQSAPTTPQILPGTNSYTPIPSMEQMPYQADPGYFPELLTAAEVQQMPDFGFQMDPTYQGYYPVTRPASVSAPVADVNVQDMYMPPSVQHAPEVPAPAAGSLPPFSSYPSALGSSGSDLEIASSRPKPQCWEHGCNGRQFSTFSNLLRHQREKSGSAMKALCPYCGTEFTRTTARNGHMYGGKCKGRPEEAQSEGSPSAGERE